MGHDSEAAASVVIVLDANILSALSWATASEGSLRLTEAAGSASTLLM